jgi:hypothetical protein
MKTKSNSKFPSPAFERRTGAAKALAFSLLAVLPAVAAQQPNIQSAQPNIQYAQNYGGADVGAQINAAYAALPESGGEIVVSKSATFRTPSLSKSETSPFFLWGCQVIW